MKRRTLEYSLANGSHLLNLHLPKTAGTRLAYFLDRHVDRDRTVHLDVFETLRVADRDTCLNATYLIASHTYYDLVSKVLGTHPVCITMMREPVERFISHVAHLQRIETPLMRPVELAAIQGMTLDEFVFDDRMLQDTKVADLQTRFIAETFAEGVGPEQVAVMPNGDVDVDLARRRLDGFAFVGITERFEDSLALLCYTFGWRPPRELEHLNVAFGRPTRDRMAPATVRRIEELTALDRELYQYATTLFADRYAQMTEELVDRHGCEIECDRRRPLPRSVLVELLERHYDRRFEQRHPKVARARIDFNGAVTGDGWHVSERSADVGTFRWTGPEPTATLDVALASDRDLRLRFRVLAALSPEVLASLRVTVNDHPLVFERRFDEWGACLCEARIGREILAIPRGFTRLSFHVDRTVAPAEVDATSRDARRLGVAVNWVEFEPAS